MAGAAQNIVGEVGLLVTPVDPNQAFNAGLNKIIAQLEKNAQFQIKASGLEDIQQQANGIGNAFAQASIEAAGLTAAVYGIHAAVTGTIQKFSGLFDQLAQAKAGFSSILKSEAAGNNLLDQIREFARVSPFVTQELVNYSQQLLGVGESANKIIPLLKSTGDILSSVGGDTTQLGRVLFTLTQIKSIGSLKGQDTLQLQNSLIPITKYLSDYLGKTSAEIVKLRENGQITADQVFNAINAQGEKVKGAMDKATRNIVGARAILSDTVTILLQNQPVLNKIFTDMYKAILSFANFLGTDTFSNAFASFFKGLDSVYQGLKPLFESLSKLSASGSISTLQILGTVLGTIGDALSAIPKGVMDVFARLLAGLITIRAPLLLIQYASSIQRIVTAIVPAVTGLGKLGSATTQTASLATRATQVYMNQTAALDANTRALTANQRAMLGEAFATQSATAAGQKQGFLSRHGQGLQTLAAIGLTAGGQYLSQSKNEDLKVAGTALTGAGIGLSVGGPAGAAAGLAIGGLIGYLNKQKEALRKWTQEIKDIGSQGAKDFVDAQNALFGGNAGTGNAKAYQQRISELQNNITKEQDRKTAFVTSDNFDPFSEADQTKVKRMDDALLLLNTQLTDVKKSQTDIFEPTLIGLRALVPSLDTASAAYKALTDVQRGNVRVVTSDIPKAEEALKKYGISLADLADPDKREGLLTLIQNFDGLTTAQQQATAAAEKYNSIFAAAKTQSAAVFDAQEKQIQSQIDDAKSLVDIEAAQRKITDDASLAAANLAALKGEELKRQQTIVQYQLLGISLAAATSRANIDGEIEYQRLLGLRKEGVNEAAIASRRNNANLNDPANNDPFSYNLYAQQETLREEAKKAAEKAAQEADAAAKKAQAWADTMKGAADSLSSRLQSAADNIAAAADRWVGSIKDRTQYEQAISVGTLTRNARRQVSDLTELSSGITTLRARGLSDEVMKSLGINNIADLKQVRKLLKASPGDLTTLSGAVSTLNQNATDLATREENARTQQNISLGIQDAAKTLGVDFTKAQATDLARTINITTTTNADEIAAAVIAALSSGKTSR